MRLTRDEQRFLIGHELLHIRKHHVRKETILDAVISYSGMSLSTLGAITLWEDLSTKKRVTLDWNSWAASHYKGKAPYTEELAYNAEKVLSTAITLWLLGSCASYCLGHYYKLAYGRSHEEEADCLAAHELNCALGGCLLFFKRSLKSGTSINNTFSETHPTDFKRFFNLLMISGDTTLLKLVIEPSDDLSDEEYVKSIIEYLEVYLNATN